MPQKNDATRMNVRRRAVKSNSNYMNKIIYHSNSSRSFPAEEGSVHAAENVQRALDVGHGPSSIIDPLSTAAINLGSRPCHHLTARESVSDPNHRDRKLELISLETTFGGGIGGQGVMFDIRTKSEAVQIRSLTFHAHNETDQCNVKVFTKKGTHRNFEEKSTAWTNVVNIVMRCEDGRETIITSSMFDSSLSDELTIEADSTRAFYIDSHNALRYTKTDHRDEVYTEDKYVQVLEGTGLSELYGDLHIPRMWNGQLSYELLLPHTPFGCMDSLDTSLIDTTKSYGHMFDIGSNYPGGIIIEGLEFYTDETTLLNYEIYTTPKSHTNFISSTDWDEVAKGRVSGGGADFRTAIVGRNVFKPIIIEADTKRGFYITLDTQNLRYSASKGRTVGDVFASNNYITIGVGVGVANYPLGGKFFYPRQWSGRVLYRTIRPCPEPISVMYVNEVRYPKSLTSVTLLKEVSATVKSFFDNFIKTNPELISLLKESGNSISTLSTKTIKDFATVSCASSNESELCDTLLTTVEMGDVSTSEIGHLKVLLLQHNTAVSEAIGSVYNAKSVGDKLVDSETQLVLKGVRSSTMGSTEKAYLEEAVKSFLNKNPKLGDIKVEILSVEVIKIDTLHTRLLIENSLFSDPSQSRRNLDDGISDIRATIVTSGKHRAPPDIGSDFDSIVKDWINLKPEDLIEELSENTRKGGGGYFSQMTVISATEYISVSASAPTVSPPPFSTLDSTGPSSAPTSINIEDNKGMLIMMIIAAVATLVLCAGSYWLYKCIRRKHKETGKQEDEKPVQLFPKPMLDDWSQNSEDNVFGKKYTGDTLKSGVTGVTSATSGTSSFYNSSMHPVDLEQEVLTINGMGDTHHAMAREGSYGENKKFYDRHRPSLNHTLPCEFDNNSMISGRSGRSRSSRRKHSPSGRSRANSRRPHSPSGRSRASSIRSARRTHSPSDRSKRSSARTHSPPDRSKRSSARTRSPSGRDSVSASIRSMSRTADYGEGSSAVSGKYSKQSKNSGFKAVHGCNPPARRKKAGAGSLSSDNKERAGFNRNSSGKSRSIARSSNQRNVRDNDKSSRRSGFDGSCREKLIKSPSDERSMASDSTSSTISTKGRNIPGKLYN